MPSASMVAMSPGNDQRAPSISTNVRGAAVRILVVPERDAATRREPADRAGTRRDRAQIVVDDHRLRLRRERERGRCGRVARRERHGLRGRLGRADALHDPQHARQPLQQLDLHGRGEHAPARSEQQQRRRVVPVGFGAQRRDEWARACVTDEVQRVHALAFDQSEHVRHVDVRVGVEHELAAAEQRAERRPLAARVHERSERERDVLLRTGVARREERTESLRGIVDDRRARSHRGRRSAGRRGSRRRARRRRCLPGATPRPSGGRSCRRCTGRSGRRPSARRSRAWAIRTPRTVRSVRARHRRRASTARDRHPRRGTRSPRPCSASSHSRARPGPCSSRA